MKAFSFPAPYHLRLQYFLGVIGFGIAVSGVLLIYPMAQNQALWYYVKQVLLTLVITLETGVLSIFLTFSPKASRRLSLIISAVFYVAAALCLIIGFTHIAAWALLPVAGAGLVSMADISSDKTEPPANEETGRLARQDGTG